MTHTPGPWIFSPERDTHDSIIHTADAVEKHGYIGADNGGVVGSSEWIWIKDEDARLIAAAPDLLEALEGAIGALEQDLDAGRDSGDADWEGLAFQRLEAARAAIAKARGETA